MNPDTVSFEVPGVATIVVEYALYWKIPFFDRTIHRRLLMDDSKEQQGCAKTEASIEKPRPRNSQKILNFWKFWTGQCCLLIFFLEVYFIGQYLRAMLRGCLEPLKELYSSSFQGLSPWTHKGGESQHSLKCPVALGTVLCEEIKNLM